MTRAEAIEIARAAAKAGRPSYYAEPFEPHPWVVDAILVAAGSRPMTIRFRDAVDQLQELLDTRPSEPTVEELKRWWDSSVAMLPGVLDEFGEQRKAVRQLRDDLDGARAALRREQDARAQLRVELDRTKAERDEARRDCDAYAEFDEHVRDLVEAADKWHDRECSGESNVCLETDDHAPECPYEEAEDRLFQAVRAIQPITLAPHPRIVRLTAERDAARTAAQKFVALVDDLGAFVNDNDPRAMAIAGPLGEAQCDLYAALGLDLDKEAARQRADIESRCAVCGWMLAASVAEGCVRGNCSLRPRPEHLYAPERAAREWAEACAPKPKQEPCCPSSTLPGSKHDIGCRAGGKVR